MKKEFHLSDVLSVTTGRLVSTRGMEGVYDILGFLVGRDLFTHELPAAGKLCAPLLGKQYNGLSEENMEEHLKTLDMRMAEGKASAEVVVREWVDEMVDLFGESCMVASLPKKKVEGLVNKNPLETLAEAIGTVRK